MIEVWIQTLSMSEERMPIVGFVSCVGSFPFICRDWVEAFLPGMLFNQV